MGNIITFIISTILQTIMYSYFAINIASLFSKKKFSKKQLFVAILLICLLGPSSKLCKELMPALNVIITLGILLLNIYFVMKIKFLESA